MYILLYYSLGIINISNFMENISSWEGNSCLSNQKISHHLKNLNVQFLAHKSPHHWTLSWARRVQSTSSHPVSISSILLLSLHLCIVSQVSLPFKFTNYKVVYIYQQPHACYIPFPFHPPSDVHLNNIWWRVQIMELFIMQCFQFPIISSLLGPSILLSTLFSETLYIYLSPSFTATQNNR
jgi:hypothetical protein